MLPTGCVVGVASNVFGAGFPPRFVPAFSWGGAERFQEYDAERAIETARIVFARRAAVFTSAHDVLLRHVHRLTSPQRQWA